MSLESILERIAIALEKTNASAAQAVASEPAPAKAPKKAPAVAPASSTAPVTAPAVPTAPAKVLNAEVADALIALVQGKSRDAAVSLLAKFGAKKAPELKPADYAAFIAEAKAQLAPAGGDLI